MIITERAPKELQELLGQPPMPKPDGNDNYSIGEVATHTTLSIHTLRWYEQIGLLGQIERNSNGQRRYNNNDLSWLAFIVRLRLTGMSVTDMVAYANLLRKGPATAQKRRLLLEQHRARLAKQIDELQATTAVLDWKINHYAEMNEEGTEK